MPVRILLHAQKKFLHHGPCSPQFPVVSLSLKFDDSSARHGSWTMPFNAKGTNLGSHHRNADHISGAPLLCIHELSASATYLRGPEEVELMGLPR